VNTRLTQHEMVELYITLMGEIRKRIDAIEPCIKKKTGLERHIEWELCFLQLRKICELISIGCLVAHGDIEKVHGRALSKAWNPNDIIVEMEKLHSKFFPIAAVLKGTTDGIKQFTAAPAGHLTKEGLLDIYGKAGDALHSGNLRSIVRGRVIKVSFNEINAWTHQIIDLLKVHFILPRHGKGGLLCVLKNTLKDGDVTVSIFEKLSPKEAQEYVVTRPKT
jgi:hypothetical protein